MLSDFDKPSSVLCQFTGEGPTLAEREPDEAAFEKLRRGVVLKDGLTRPV